MVMGAMAGVASVLVTYPLDFVRSRITVQAKAAEGARYKGLVDAIVRITAEEGPFALYRGLNATVMGIMPYLGVQFMTYGTLR